jgi:beta-galactosidase
VRGHQVGGQFFLQEYRLAGGTAAGQFANWHLAAVENKFGRGKTLLIGTFPGGSYERTHAPETRAFFADLLAWAGLKPQLASSDADVKARLHRGAGGTYLWIVNPTRVTKTVKISLPSAFQTATELWPEANRPTLAGDTLTTTLEDRNAAVLRLN